jgi:hypothetical protein
MDDFVVVGTREIGSSLIEYTVSIAPAKHIRVMVPRRMSTAENRDAVIRATIASGRFLPLPLSPPRES